MVRHQFSRKRGALSEFLDDTSINKHIEEMELLEVLRDNQLDILGISKGKTAMEMHIEELLAQYRSLTTGVNSSSVPNLPTEKVEMSVDAAGALLSKIEQEAEEESKNKEEFIDMNAEGEGPESDCSIDKELFFKGI